MFFIGYSISDNWIIIFFIISNQITFEQINSKVSLFFFVKRGYITFHVNYASVLFINLLALFLCLLFNHLFTDIVY